MLTPKFSVNQDENSLFLEISVPFGKLAEGEIYIEENNFIFYAKPYYLRLHFSGKLQENSSESVQYDSEKGLCRIRIHKANPGEQFTDLEMLTKLLTPQKQKTTVGIEVLGETANIDAQGENLGDEWTWDQELHVEDEEATTSKYGFADRYQGIFKRLQGELPDAVDVKDPDDKGRDTRLQERLEHERDHFSDDHYLADLYEDDTIKGILRFETRWGKKQEPGQISFSDEERQRLVSLPKREYLLDANTKQTLMFGLVDVLFAFAYDRRTTFGEGTVETSWNICKLSATLSWLHRFRSLTETVTSAVRRSLCYPLYRHWDLAMAVLQDTVDLLNTGPTAVVKALLVIHGSLSSSEYYYIMNDIYILDYLIWAQYLSAKDLSSLAEALCKIRITKEDVGLDLPELEAAGKIVSQETDTGKQESLGDKMKSLSLRTELDSDDDVS